LNVSTATNSRGGLSQSTRPDPRGSGRAVGVPRSVAVAAVVAAADDLEGPAADAVVGAGNQRDDSFGIT
jgi:hypothetical protein